MIVSPIFRRSIAFSVFAWPIGSYIHAYDRRVLLPNESIADYLDRKDTPRFTITAQVQGNEDANTSNLWGGDSPPSTISVDVTEALPAITSDTVILSADGTPIRFGDTSNSLDTLLVSDAATSVGRSGLTILAVDPVTREMQGVVEQKGGKSMQIRQGSLGGIVTATEEEIMVMPDWECGVGKHENLFHRTLEEDHHHAHDGHEHEHHHHDHDHEDDFDPTISAIENLSRSLRGTKINSLNERRIQSSTKPYNYQVDLFLEIDNDFITNTGGGVKDAAGITANAYNYINALVTAANVIYESEIDTHLHVNTIKLSTLYDSANSTSDALSIMRSNYANSIWHTAGVDIHHALLGKGLGGGVAYIGVVCSSGWAYGLTASVSGSFVSLNQKVVWDLKAFMHELGHNFSSGHTHDSYSPAIDTCGTSCPSGAGNKWSTLMSYCQHCTGNYANIMYSFGGIYDGSGAKSDISNWMDKPELVANYDSTHQSVDPRREAHKMYSHVSSRGTCVNVPVSGPPAPTFKPTAPVPTLKPSAPPTEAPVTYATYDSSLKVPKCASAAKSCSSGNLLDGRGNLGPGEQGKAPNTLGSCTDGATGTYHSDESIDRINVASVDGGLLSARKTAEITATVYVYSQSQDFVDFYYATNPFSPTWTLIGTASPPGGGAQTMKMQYTLPSGSLQAVRVVIRWNGNASNSNPFTCPSSGYDDIDDIVFAVSGGIETTPNPTFSPTRKPTTLPTSNPTNNPTANPTKKPSLNPTNQPTDPPTRQPTKIPTNSPTKMPVTSAPSKKPTRSPSKQPVTSPPTNTPTRNPTNKPTDTPTRKPTNSPTKQPVTNAPSRNPTYSPSKKPVTSPPTNNPTSFPTTANPTKKPATASMNPTNVPTSKPTYSPSRKPTYPPTPAPSKKPAGAPTNKPTVTATSAPTSSSNGPQEAVFDGSLKAPRCVLPGSSCSSGLLVDGRPNFSTGKEPNPSNTIDGCVDGNTGTYRSDESINKVVVRSGEVDGSGSGVDIVAGGRATIVASVFAWSSGASDTADFFYTSDAFNPNWQYIGSITPPGGQDQELKMAYTLPAGKNQAVRVQFRYGGSLGTCTSGSYNDRDDVVFAVKVPPQQASYDSTLTVPRCSLYGSECNSLSLLNGRGTMSGGNEQNTPNTLVVCADGNTGTYHSDESVDKIVVRSGEVDGSGSGVNMETGGRATIIATVFPYGSGVDDFADFYYASDASNPVWQFIGTKQPVGSGAQELKISYNLPDGNIQAVRVNFRYKGVQGTNGACSSGVYDDTDDLAFSVKPSSSFTAAEADVVFEAESTKNVLADALKRAEIHANKRGRSRKKQGGMK